MYWLGEPTPQLDPKEEVRLIQQYKNKPSKEISRIIIKSNIGLIVDLVSRYQKIYSLDSSDMFHEGVLGAYKALDKFDLKFGVKFSTYLTNWVNTYILSHIKKNARIVTVTEYANSQLLKFKKEDHEKLKDKWGGYKYNQIKVLSDVPNYDKSIKRDVKSFTNTIRGLDNKNINESMNEVIKTFSPKEKLTIRCRYSLNKIKKKTLEEIGKPFNITKERVRQIEKKALKKLRVILKRKGIKVGDLYD